MTLSVPQPVISRYSTTIQEYVETIRDLLAKRQVARAKDIACMRGVTRSSVSTALANLRELGLIDHENYGYVILTTEGIRLGQELQRRHQIIQHFLAHILGLPDKLADEEACRLEHAMSPEALQALVRFAQAREGCQICENAD